MKYLMLLSAFLFFNSQVRAEVDGTDLALADETVDSPSLNIEGQYQEKEVAIVKEAPKKIEKKLALKPVVKKQLSSSEKIKLYREQLELRNKIMIEKKMEQIRLQQEIALAKKLEQSMNQTIQNIDNSIK